MNIERADVVDHGDESLPQPLEATLNLLSAVGAGTPVSQRSLAGRLGVALGLANALVRRCVKKGYIKISTAPARRYVYYLTPAGFAEKSRLVGEYIESSLSFFRSARVTFAHLFADAAQAGQRRVLLVGSGELAEIALLAAEDSGVTLLGVLDASRNAATFHGLAVFRDLDEAPPFDAVVLADARDAQGAYARLAERLAEARILVPALLHVTRRSGAGGRA